MIAAYYRVPWVRTTLLQLIEKVDSLTKAGGNDANGRPRKKRKVSDLSTSRMRSTPGPSSERDFVEVIDDMESGEETRAGDYVPSSDTEENEAQMQGMILFLSFLKCVLCFRSSSLDFLLVERIVDCPVCGQSIITKNVNEHLDSGCKSYLATSKTKQKDTRNA